LDVPAQTIPAYDLERVSEAGDSVRGQQHPTHWLRVLRGIDLTDHHDIEADLVWKRSRGTRRPRDLDAIETERDGGGALLPAPLCRHLDLISISLRQRVSVGEQQILFIGETAIARGAHQEVGARAGSGHCSEQVVDIAFSVAHDGNGRRGAERLNAVASDVDPALGFFVRDRAFLAIRADLALAFPNPPARELNDAAMRCIDHQAGVNEEAEVAAIAGESEPAAAAGMSLIVDLAGVLDRQNVAAGNPRRTVIGRRCQHLGWGHMRAVEKARIAHLASMSIAEPPKANGTPRTHRTQQIGPPFWRRRSPKCPSPTSCPVMPTSPNQKVIGTNRITRESRHANAVRHPPHEIC